MAQKRKSKKDCSLTLSGGKLVAVSFQLWNIEEVNDLLNQNSSIASQLLAQHITVTLTKANRCLIDLCGKNTNVTSTFMFGKEFGHS